LELFHRSKTTKQISADEAIFPAREKRLKQDACYQRLRSTNEGLVMWDIIIGLFYHRSCRKHLADMRKHRWNLAVG
jgi:hypothetical protein